MGGLSARKLLTMKIFAAAFPDGPITQQPVAQLPWGHVLEIMRRIKDPAARGLQGSLPTIADMEAELGAKPDAPAKKSGGKALR